LAEVGRQAPVSAEQLSFINPYAVTLRYDDIDIELVSPRALRETVEALLKWAEQILVMDAVNNDTVPPASTI
jgi:hypothetical protein